MAISVLALASCSSDTAGSPSEQTSTVVVDGIQYSGTKVERARDMVANGITDQPDEVSEQAADVRVRDGKTIELLWKGGVLPPAVLEVVARVRSMGLRVDVIGSTYSDIDLAVARSMVAVGDLMAGPGWKIEEIGARSDYDALLVRMKVDDPTKAPNQQALEAEAGVEVDLRVS